MHIHSYQIHNVLDVYRRQLSRGTARNIANSPDRNPAAPDRVDISDHGQRQTLFEKISSEIVQRITQIGPDTGMGADLSVHSADSTGGVRDEAEASECESPVFSYTMIDNNNQKTTHNLSTRQLDYSAQKVKSLIATPSNSDSVSDKG